MAIVYNRLAGLNEHRADGDRVLRLFAIECAERVLHRFERKYTRDARPRKAIQAARDYVDGKIDANTRTSAAMSAKGASDMAAQDGDGPAAWAASAAWGTGAPTGLRAARAASLGAEGSYPDEERAPEVQWQHDRIDQLFKEEQ